MFVIGKIFNGFDRSLLGSQKLHSFAAAEW